jgi:hypothetical protein
MQRRAFYSVTAFLVFPVVLLVASCTSSTPNGDDSTGTSSSALTAAQCSDFSIDGKVTICHRTGSAKHPYTLVKISEKACINAHAAHVGDYITSTDPSSPLYDPTCQGLGCLPPDVPCDDTVPCCEGMTCEAGICVAPDPCLSSPCGENGDCLADGDSYTCDCYPGWTGNTCEIDIDECESSPCVNGDCTDLIDAYECTCWPGWTGDNCEIEIGWRSGPELPIPRIYHQSLMLDDEHLMVLGGFLNEGGRQMSLSDVWLLDLRIDTWEQVASMNEARHFDSNMTGAVLLGDGRVLVVCGYRHPGNYLGTAEIYDPRTNAWTLVPPIYRHGMYYSMNLLADGRVLVVGGNRCFSDDEAGAEIFDPATDTWTATTSFPFPKKSHAAVLLEDGRVLVAGGTHPAGMPSSYLFDPEDETWTVTGSPSSDFIYTQALRLADGRVLMAMGFDAEEMIGMAGAEIYDPESGTWSVTSPLVTPRVWASLTLLDSGRVTMVGGCASRNCDWGELASVELFDSVSGTWSAGPDLLTRRSYHTATLLPNGELFVVGGQTDRWRILGSTEILGGLE